MDGEGSPQEWADRGRQVSIGERLSRDYWADYERGKHRRPTAENRAVYAAWDAEDRRLDRLIAYGPWWKRRRYRRQRAENTMRFLEWSDRWHEERED